MLTLEVDGDGKLILVGWYADAAFAVHADMKSHTGFTGALGKGAFTTGSSKQKLNTTSSTEAELVAAHEALLYALWTRLFLINQGFECKTTIYQDNTSAILLDSNGVESSSKRTRHLDIRFFFITDCKQKGYIEIKYCPTDQMTGDYPSKPLQGKAMTRHLKSMLNLTEG